MKWQPIETANPTNGESLLVFDESIHEAWWYEEKDGYDAHWSDAYGNIVHPTHWMPIPDPPCTGG